MTIKEALASGYTHCGVDGREYQTLMKLSEMTEGELEGKRILLADKQSMRPSISEEELKILIAETIESDWGNDTCDDTEQVFNTVTALDFSPTASMINEALKHIASYKLTKIALIKSTP